MSSSASASGRSSRGNGIKTPSKNESNTNNNESDQEDVSVDNSNEADDDEDDEEEVTRCVCTLTNPPDPDNQGYIQCDKCAAWQHQACVGISPEMGEELDKYWCELCKPELHSLHDLKITRRQQSFSPDDSLKRSQYSTTPHALPTERRARTPRKAYSNEDTNKEEIDSGEDKKIVSRPLKKRSRADASPSTRQSRNRSSAAEREELQYQNMLKKVLQESKKDAYRENEDQLDDYENEGAHDIKKEDVEQSDLEAVKSEDNAEETPNGEYRRSKRRRAASPRVEQSPTFSTDLYNAEEEPQNTPNRRQMRRITSKTQAGSIDSMLDADSEVRKHPLNEEEDDNEENKNTEAADVEDTASVEQKPRRTYNRRTAQSATAVKPAETSRRGGNSKPKTKTANDADINEDDGTQQSHMDKLLKLAQEPSRPRQTPEDITVEEMYERVTAISAFLERSKEELMFLQRNQGALLSFVENPEFIEEYKKNVDFDSLLNQMNNLNNDLANFGKI